MPVIRIVTLDSIFSVRFLDAKLGITVEIFVIVIVVTEACLRSLAQALLEFPVTLDTIDIVSNFLSVSHYEDLT